MKEMICLLLLNIHSFLRSLSFLSFLSFLFFLSFLLRLLSFLVFVVDIRCRRPEHVDQFYSFNFETPALFRYILIGKFVFVFFHHDIASIFFLFNSSSFLCSFYLHSLASENGQSKSSIHFPLSPPPDRHKRPSKAMVPHLLPKRLPTPSINPIHRPSILSHASTKPTVISSLYAISWFIG